MKVKEYFSHNFAVLTLILINLGIYIALIINPDLSSLFLLEPNLNMVMSRPWTLLTVFFSHELHIHILLNMLLVLIFGTQLNRATNGMVVWGVYLLCGLIGSLVSLVYAPLIGYSGGPIAGASAAAFGIVATYVALEPNKIILKSKAKYWLIALFLVNAVLTIQNPQVSVGGPAHAIGIIEGFVFGYLLKMFSKKE